MAGGSARLGSRRLFAVAFFVLLGAAHVPGPLAAQTVELLMVEEPGCPWCRRWHAEVGVGYPRSAEGKRAPLRSMQIHEPAPAGVQLARPVRATPTFILVSNGREAGRITGYPGPDFFWPMLEELLRKLTPAQSFDAGATPDVTSKIAESP